MNLKKWISKRGILLSLALLAIFFIPWLWYQGSDLIIGGDLTFPLDPKEYFLSIFQIWRRVFTGGDSAISLTTVPFYAPMAFFEVLGFSLQTIQKMHFGLWLALPAISIFYLAGVIFVDHPRKLLAQLVAVTVFLFNTYEVVWADSARMAVWVGMPLMLGFFIQGLKDRKPWRWAAALALTSITTSTAAANPPMFIMFAAVFLFWLIFHFLTTPGDRNLNGLKRIGIFVGLTFILSFAVNLFWIVPYAKVLLNQYSGALSSGLEGIQFQDWLGPVSTYTSLLNVFRMQGAWDWYAGWQGEPYVPAAFPYQHNPFYLAWSILIPVLAFGALLIKNKQIDRRVILFFVFLALVGILFGAGSHQPSGRVYQWLIDHIPFLSIYRSPWYKFSTWTALGYSILIAASLAELAGWLEQATSRSWPTRSKLLPAALIGLFIVGNLTYSSGLVLGKVFPRKEERKRLHSAHVTFPDYFFSAADWINQQPGDWRILQLPLQPAFNYHWGLGTLMDMTIFAFNQPTLWWPEQTGSGLAKPGSDQVVKDAYDELYRGRFTQVSRLLGLLNVRYLLQKDDIDYSFYGTKDSPEFIRQKLAKQSVSLAHQEGPWQFYELDQKDQRPLFFPTNQLVWTGPARDGFLHSIYSENYRPDLTYTDYQAEAARTLEGGSYYITPNINKIEALAKDRIRMPFTINQETAYTLVFNKAEAAALYVDDQPVSLETVGDQVKSQPLTLSAGQHSLDIEPTSETQNLVENPSFETGVWEKPIDASKHRPGEPDLKGELIADATDGSQAVQLTAHNHTAAIRHGIDQFENDRLYLLSFDYKSGFGEAPSYTLWQEGSLASEPAGRLEKKKDWTHFTTVLKPRPMTTGGILFLYADGGEANTPTQAAYDNVRIVKIPKIIDSLALISELPKATALPKLEYRRLSSTEYQVKVEGATGPYLVNFLEQFDKGWQASIDGRLVSPHLEAYDYANAWYVNQPGDYTIRIRFAPQRLFLVSAAVTLAGLIFCLALLWPRRKKETT